MEVDDASSPSRIKSSGGGSLSPSGGGGGGNPKKKHLALCEISGVQRRDCDCESCVALMAKQGGNKNTNATNNTAEPSYVCSQNRQVVMMRQSMCALS